MYAATSPLHGGHISAIVTADMSDYFDQELVPYRYSSCCLFLVLLMGAILFKKA